jgi:hypothetical protein
MNQNLHKLIGTKMKSGNKGVRGMSIKNMEKFIKNHGQSLLRIKRDRMSLGKLMSEFKEGRNKLEEGRTSPKKSMSPKKNTNNANFKTMMKSVSYTKLGEQYQQQPGFTYVLCVFKEQCEWVRQQSE